jgi:hypothetical protein
MKPEKNWLYDSAKQKLLAANMTAEYDDVILEALSQMNDLTKSGNKTLLFKCQLSTFEKSPRLEQRFKENGHPRSQQSTEKTRWTLVFVTSVMALQLNIDLL